MTTKKPATTEPANLEVITGKIKACLANIAGNIIEIGRQLKAAKSLVAHGAWQYWLRDNFAMTDRTARNYMRVAEYFGDKTENFSVFKPAKMLELTKIPAAEVETFLAQMAAAGSPAESLTVRDLREAVKKWNDCKPRKSSPAKPVTIDVDAITTITAEPARSVQLTLFDNLPAPLTPPQFLLPPEIIKAAEEIDAPISLITRAGLRAEISTPSIVVAMATPLATWLTPLMTKAAALIPCRLKFPSNDGQLRLKAATILYYGNAAAAFASAFRFFGAALKPIF